VNPDGTVMTDARGLPIFGPVGAPQLFTTDPGRAAITGRPQDFQAFDVPQLRGIANTAPYFHDNLVETLEEMVDLYSHTILPLIPAIGLFPIHPRPGSFFGAESLSEQEKADLVEFLRVF